MDKLISAAKDYLDDDKQQPQQQQHHQPQQQQQNYQQQSSGYDQQQQGGYGQDRYDQQQQQQPGGYGQDRYDQQQSSSGFGQTGGRYEQESGQGQQQQYQQPPSTGASRPAGGLASFFGNLDFDTAKDEAAKNAGSSGDRDMFSNILNLVGQKQNKIAEEDVDEEDAVKKHKKTYNDEDDNNDSRSLGTAAAMQALKMFNQGEAGSGKSSNSQSMFLGLAMSEASKLFDSKASQGKVDSDASKESTVQSAAEMAMKMYMKSQGQQQGGLMGFASKFM